jgi:LacI family transcriptional regulator
MPTITIRDVAREAGVGVGTVSRVLNNSEQVTPRTRERVQAAIQKLGFQPNKVARQLPRGTRVRNVGVILPFMSYYSFVERLRGAQVALSQHDNDYELILYNVSSPERYQEQLATIVQQGILEGLLVVTLNMSAEQQELLHKAHIPFVCVADRCADLPTCVGVDNVEGGYMATRHLLDLGHRQIAYIGDAFPDEFGFPTSEDRYAGYALALREFRLDVNPDYVRLGPHARDVAQSLTTELLKLPDPPSAIFAMSDLQALGAVAALREAGVRVPDEMSLIGFDDLEISHYIGLTTIRQYLEDSGRLGMQFLLELIHHKSTQDESPLVAPTLSPLKLIERQTTAKR